MEHSLFYCCCCFCSMDLENILDVRVIYDVIYETHYIFKNCQVKSYNNYVYN